MNVKLAVGDPLPSVGLRATDGYLLNLRSFVTKQPAVFLFFGAPTLKGTAAAPGLAAVQALASGYRRLQQAGIGVAAISCDSEREQTDFVAQHELPFLILSDERRSAVEMLGIGTSAQRDNVNVARPIILAVDVQGDVRAVIDRIEPQYLVEQLISVLSEPIPAATEDAAAAS